MEGVMRFNARFYTDRVDVNWEISLYEYGLIRNPRTNKTIYCLNTYDLDASWGKDLKTEPHLVSTFISLQDVKEALENLDNGFFSFIGETKENVISNITNEYLTSYIQSIDAYNGSFIDTLRDY
jgi:hypothetical protein